MPLYFVTKEGKHFNVFEDFSLVTNHICYIHTVIHVIAKVLMFLNTKKVDFFLLWGHVTFVLLTNAKKYHHLKLLSFLCFMGVMNIYF